MHVTHTRTNVFREGFVACSQKMLKGVLCCLKDECLNWVTIAVKCAVVYEISTFWLENKKAETEENIQLPKCTAAAAFQGHTYYFLARTVISTVVEQQTTANIKF